MSTTMKTQCLRWSAPGPRHDAQPPSPAQALVWDRSTAPRLARQWGPVRALRGPVGNLGWSSLDKTGHKSVCFYSVNSSALPANFCGRKGKRRFFLEPSTW